LSARAQTIGGHVTFNNDDDTFSVTAVLPLARVDDGRWE